MIRSKADAATLIPRPTMGHTSQRIACLGWTITRYCMDLRLNGQLIAENDLLHAIWSHRAAINADVRRATG